MASSARCSTILIRANPLTSSGLFGLGGMVLVNSCSAWSRAFDVASLIGRRDSPPYRPAGLRSRRCGGNDLGPYLQRGCAFLVVRVRQVGVGNEAAQAYDTSLQNTTAMGANSAQQHDT